MRKSIKKIIDELEEKSRKERTKRYDVKPEDRMLAITYETGQFIHSLIVGIRAKSALELGTSTGYSTLWIADAILTHHKTPRITTIERNPKKIERAIRNFKRAGVSRFIRIRKDEIGNVLKGLPRNTKFDFVLIDADKENVIEYARLIIPHLKDGGVMVTDNMLYPKKYRKMMRQYSMYLASRQNLQTCTLAIGNGQEITVKKG